MTFPSRPTRTIGVAMAVAATAGCGPGQSPRVVIVRDSAGVTIVENVRAEWPVDAEWMLATEPMLVLSDFADVSGVTLLSDGAVVVLDAVSHRLSFFDPHGRLRASVGRAGAGPGEFGSPGSVRRYRGDSVVVFDPALGRLSLYSALGVFGRSVPVRLAAQRTELVGTLDDGSFVVRSGGFTPRRGIRQEPAVLVRLTADGAQSDTLGLFAGEEFYTTHYEGRPVYGRRPFGRTALAVTAGAAVITNVGDDCTLTIRRLDAVVTTSVRPPCRRRALPHLAIERFQQARIGGMRTERSRAFVAAIYWSGRVPYPRQPPPYDRLLIDDAGSLWAGQYALPGDSARVWSVFPLNGRLLGSVITPADVAIHQIGVDRLVGVVRDDLGRARVETWPLLRRNPKAWRIGQRGWNGPDPNLTPTRRVL